MSVNYYLFVFSIVSDTEIDGVAGCDEQQTTITHLALDLEAMCMFYAEE
jgi:hypothetical protein